MVRTTAGRVRVTWLNIGPGPTPVCRAWPLARLGDWFGARVPPRATCGALVGVAKPPVVRTRTASSSASLPLVFGSGLATYRMTEGLAFPQCSLRGLGNATSVVL